MKVEVWSDLTCPWCGLGIHRLDRAVEQFAHGGGIEVLHRSFPLDRGIPPGGPTVTMRNFLKQSAGMDDAQVEAAVGRVEELAGREGLDPYIVRDNNVGNTELAHELLAHATAQGKHTEGWRLFLRAYFGQARSLFGLEALLELGGELGLEQRETRQALTERRYRHRVRDDVRRAQALGARGVPFTVIDGRHIISGAQESDTLIRAFQKVWDTSHAPLDRVPPAREAADDACGPDGCAAPGADPPGH
ncbi:DSBA-like thioredoxin domain protein [Streptomyces sp. ADI93-02]|nr:DsbA family protein [Streptomyces sp. ADI93-02]RPK32129.1 DSBA-like thioredoxin domain protein [Streptomyces sp. ADI93-02]